MRRYKALWNTVLTLALLLTILSPLAVHAGEKEYENDDTGYTAIVNDEGDVLDSSSERDLMKEMRDITDYGNVCFLSVVAKGYADDDVARELADAYYQDEFGTDDGLIVAIVLDGDRKGGCTVWLEAYGGVYQVINSSYALTITDNAVSETRSKAHGSDYYGYDGTRNYYGYASVCMEQALRVLAGQKIAQPMKYVTSALLAMILAVMINFIVVRAVNTARVPSKDEMLKGLYSQCMLNEPQMILTNTTKVYDPPSSSGGGGGGHGGGGGGGHGGGGHRG